MLLDTMVATAIGKTERGKDEVEGYWGYVNPPGPAGGYGAGGVAVNPVGPAGGPGAAVVAYWVDANPGYGVTPVADVNPGYGVTPAAVGYGATPWANTVAYW
jgi:hypothetical protein